MLQDRIEAVVTTLETIMGDLPRLGGSNARREVAEDTLIHALLGCGQIDEAQAIIRVRLERRGPALDEQLSAQEVG
jgi:hypothetical protein